MINQIESMPIEDNIHPSVSSIRDLLSFKVARFSALNQRLGGYWIKEVFDLNLNDWRILGLVAASASISFKELKTILCMDKGQLSRSVKLLVERGYISTEFSKDDARALDLRITKVGRKLSKEILLFSKQRNDVAVQCLNKKECEVFLATLKKLTEHSISVLEKI